MLPSKGYFNSLDCPFYLSSTQCFRPYCHFKHPKRDPNADSNDFKIEIPKEETQTIVKPQLPLPPVVPEAPPPPVKHIPIAYIPTKPSAISVNTKRPKSIHPKNEITKNDVTSAEYDPLAVIDSSEKTYSRYSYEKQDNDSEDEFFRPLFYNPKKADTDTDSFSKFDDGSKSGYDEETDDYPDGAEFSNEEEENDVSKEDEMDTLPAMDVEVTETKTDIKEHSSTSISKEIKCKKKRKYAELNASKSNDGDKSIITSNVKQETNGTSSSPKRIKVEDKLNHINKKTPEKKICKYKDKKLSSSSKISEESSLSKKHSVSNSKDSVENKKKSNISHRSDHKDIDKSNSHKKSSSDKKSSSEKKHSSSSSSKCSDSKKHETKSSSVDKKTSSSNKNSSSHLSKSKHSSDSKHNSSSKNKSSSENKHHSSSGSKHRSSSSSKHHSSGKQDSSSEKKLKSNNGKSKEISTTKKDSSSERKHDSKSKKSPEKSSSSKGSFSHKSSSSKENRNKSNGSRDSASSKTHRDKNNLKRKHSISSSPASSTDEGKETILISDSSSSNEEDTADKKNRPNNLPVGIDDLFGLTDSDRENNHEVSESENEEEYIPKPIANSRASPVYKPTSKEDLDEIQKKIKIIPPTSSIEEYKPAQTVSKVRIAHVPNVSSLISAKTLINSGKTVPPHLQRIVTATHIVNPRLPNRNQASTSKPRPQISSNLDSNILISTRQPGLNNIFDEFIKFVDYDEAYRRAVEEETEICNIATNPQSYRNRIALCILKIRKSKGAAEVVKKEKITSASIPEYTYGLTLYECFSKYLLKPEDYVLHGYPLELPGKSGCVYIDKNSYFRNKHKGPREGPFRKCCNCGQEYAIDEETEMPLTTNDCHHHWGKPIGIARLGKIYTCCKGEVGSEPCHTSLYHVTETKNDDCLEGFVRTRPYPSDADPNKAGIYAMDCEMCFTTKGRDIVRVSMLSIDNESVYDALIKPKYPILDYCTRFSGITEEKLQNVTTTLLDVQKFILKMINDKTILVGHSLENDLKALKLIHYNVVDTSIIYPHKEGLPVKCALRTLTSRILGQAIQTGENGHDSLEDARASLMLVLHQVKEDAKSRKPRVVKQLKSCK